MFLFKTEVKIATNPIMGLGLFSCEFIPKDSIVWKFVEGMDVKITKEQLDQLNPAQKEYVKSYGWFEEDHYFFSCDLTNFINHSYDPNIKIKGDITIAGRDIEIGEEIFINYEEFDEDFENYKYSLV